MYACPPRRRGKIGVWAATGRVPLLLTEGRAICRTFSRSAATPMVAIAELSPAESSGSGDDPRGPERHLWAARRSGGELMVCARAREEIRGGRDKRRHRGPSGISRRPALEESKLAP